MSASEYTQQNVTYCTQNILSSITGIAVEPITFTINILNQMADTIKERLDVALGNKEATVVRRC